MAENGGSFQQLAGLGYYGAFLPGSTKKGFWGKSRHPAHFYFGGKSCEVGAYGRYFQGFGEFQNGRNRSKRAPTRLVRGFFGDREN